MAVGVWPIFSRQLAIMVRPLDLSRLPSVSHISLFLQHHHFAAVTATMASAMNPIRRAAPKLAKDFFVHRSCAASSPFAPLRVAHKSNFQTVRFYNSTVPLGSSVMAAQTGTPLTGLSQTISQAQKGAKKRFFPKTSSKGVAYWLLGSAASVFGIVVFGGLTRLTESGYVII